MQVTQIIRQKVLIRNLILATGIFFVSLVLGALIGQNTVEELMRQLGAVLEPLASTGNLSILLVLIIFLNNAIKALGLVFLGILLGLPPLLFIGVNGFILGGLGSALESVKGWGYVMASFVPHGVIEIPVILLAAALGLTVGMESLKWLVRRESRVKLQLSDCLRVYLRWILPGLAVAAIIEVSVTPLLIGLVNAS
ncbi:MAG: stage II sporulation protein M [Dehalococcoidia bacterium]|nr:stage II sporulation protein M [Dehalococcoidia bacterium]MDH4291106.1 stage II sporulation protein M [Dehalococcoidia bacterium]